MPFVTRLKMTLRGVYAPPRTTTPPLGSHAVAGFSTSGLPSPESGPNARLGHILDAVYQLGPGGRAAHMRRQLAQALHERDHARDWACLLEQEHARQRIGLLPTDQPSTGSADKS